LHDGAVLSTTTSKTGGIPVGFPVNPKGGPIDVTANTVVIGGQNGAGQTAGIFAASSSTIPGSDAGSIHVQAQNLLLRNNGLITTETHGPGTGGSILVETNLLDLASDSQIRSSSSGAGAAG